MPVTAKLDPAADDGKVYQVVIDYELHYSVWPVKSVEKILCRGWKKIGISGTKPKCLSWIDANWTDTDDRTEREKRREKSGVEPYYKDYEHEDSFSCECIAMAKAPTAKDLAEQKSTHDAINKGGDKPTDKAYEPPPPVEMTQTWQKQGYRDEVSDSSGSSGTESSGDESDVGEF